MARYTLLLKGGDDGTMNQEQIQDMYRRYFAWTAQLRDAGSLEAGDELKPDGRVLSANGHGIVDGPFAETKESVGGFFLISAPNYDAAVEIARGCPALDHGGVVEVRECVDHSGNA